MNISRLTCFLVGLISISCYATEQRPVIVDRESQGSIVKLDLTNQIIEIHANENDTGEWINKDGEMKYAPVETPLLPLPPIPEKERMVPAALLAQKAKQFDDGLYAAVELAAQDGAGNFAGKAALLRALAGKLSAQEGPAVTTLMAAAILGGMDEKNLPPAQAKRAQSKAAVFQSDALASKPIGFYTWSPELTKIFRQDRMLQQPLYDTAGIAKFATALNADPAVASTYNAYLQLVAGLTNPLAYADIRVVMDEQRDGKTASAYRDVRILPPSTSHEAALIKEIFSTTAPPENYSLVDDLIVRIRDGRLKLQPTETSGWYDWQTWALEPLVAPERAEEAMHLNLNDIYRASLVNLFKGLFALQRETHIKQIEILPAGMAPPGPEKIIWLSPSLHVEPLGTYYLRSALGYRFVRTVLNKTFGSKGLSAMHRVGPDGQAKQSLSDELADMENLFLGAYATSARDLGLAANGDIAANAAMPHFLAWRADLAKDADLNRDVRMMVPMFYDQLRRKTKVMVFLGWETQFAKVSYAKLPIVLQAPARVQFSKDYELLLLPVTAEVYVDNLMNRVEFRELCDREKTRGNILKALESPDKKTRN